MNRNVQWEQNKEIIAISRMQGHYRKLFWKEYFWNFPISVKIIHSEWEQQFASFTVQFVFLVILVHWLENGQNTNKILWRKKIIFCSAQKQQVTLKKSLSLPLKIACTIRSPRGFIASSGTVSKSSLWRNPLFSWSNNVNLV